MGEREFDHTPKILWQAIGQSDDGDVGVSHSSRFSSTIKGRYSTCGSCACGVPEQVTLAQETLYTIRGNRFI